MNKNILLLLGVFAFIFCMSSCEDEADPIPDIALVPVYQITDTGNNNMKTINIYRENNLLVVWDKDDKVSTFTTRNFVDSSTGNSVDGTTGETVYGEYIVTVTVLEGKVVTDENGNESTVTITHDYSLIADKETGATTIVITTTDENAAVSEKTVTGTLAEEEVFN